MRGGRAAPAAAFLLPLLLYGLTLAPTVTYEDSGEFITAAAHLGVLHPSGYPLWALLAHAFTWLPWGTVAERVHLLSAVCGAGTCWLVYRVAVRTALTPAAALVGALGLGASEIFWSQSVVAEVYTLNSFATMLVVDWAVCWRESRAPHWLWAIALGVGLGCANHPLMALAALPLLAWGVHVDWRAVLTVRNAAIGAALVTLGLSLYLYIPLRAAANPPLNVGRPDTIEKAIAHVRRDAYKTETESVRYAGDARDVGLHTAAAWTGTARALGWPLAALGLLGILTWPRERRDVLWLTFGIAIFDTLVLNAMLSARFDRWWIFAHRVYYLPTHAMAGLWVAAGSQRLLRAGERRGGRARAAALALLVGALAVGAAASYPGAHRQGDRRAEGYALDLLASAPPGAGFLPFHDEVIYPLAYMRWVAGVRPDTGVLSDDFGWDPAVTPNAVLVGSPLTDAMRRAHPDLEPWASIPRGIAYQLVPRARAARWTADEFQPLPELHEPETAGWPSGDPFAEAVTARYAVYHVRVGIVRWLEGSREEARREFARARELDPGDAFARWSLYRAYRSLGIERPRWRELLESALAAYDARVDPAVDRSYPITREAITRALASVEGSE